MTDWFADETFWKTFFPVLFSDERIEAAAEQVERVLELVDFKGTSILDLACGPGRHSVLLARKGFHVTGVDLSSFLLDKARRRAADGGVTVEWIQDDMRRFRRPGAFDLALSMFTSFGFFGNPEDDLTVVRNIFDSLAPGGACLIDTVGKEWLAAHFQPTGSYELADGTLMIERRKIVDDWSRVVTQWILLREGAATEFHLDITLYSARELKDLLRHAGFSRTQICGDLDGSAYGPDAKRLIAVAWKDRGA